MFTRAIVRPPASTFASGLTTADLGPPDLDLALKQHAAYCRALERCGPQLTVLDPDPEFPDSTFVEDAAVLTPRLAVITRPGAESRLGETAAIRRALEPFYTAFSPITPPGTLDGGDICEAWDDNGNARFFIGLSHRTNAEGASQLSAILARADYATTVIDIRKIPGILHLKSGVSWVGEGTLVAGSTLADHDAFRAWRIIRTTPAEDYGANCIRVNDDVLIPTGLPALEAALAQTGSSTIALDMSEFRTMDGGLSCLSLRF